MPEGDTIHALSHRVARLMEGQSLTHVELPDRIAAQKLRGRRVTSVFAVGKHLIMAVDEGFALQTHLGMYGQWDIHRHGQRWRRPKRLASLVLHTPQHEFVLFDAKHWRVIRVDQPITGNLAGLGPDLALRPADINAAVMRAQAESRGREVAEVLLDQRVAAGIGNVYKSEVLFMERVNPWRSVKQLTRDEWQRLFVTAAELLAVNVAHSRPGHYRVTTGIPRRMSSDLWVYDRAGRPCFRCQRTIEVKRQGELARTTWWCPRCQT